MVIIYLGICILLFILSFLLYKDLAAPPILSAAIWIVVYVLMIGSGTSYLKSEYIGCFAIALVFFVIGFLISVPRRIRAIDVEHYSVRINPVLSKPVLFLEYAFTLVYVYIYRDDILSQAASIWSSIRNSEVEMNYFLGILVNVFPIVSAVSLYVYFKNPEPKNRTYFLLTLPPLLAAMLTSNRTTWFYVLSTFAFVIIFTKQLTNKSIAKIAVLGVVAIIILFAVSSLDKFSNMQSFSSDMEKLQYYFDVYFISPALAFLQWVETHSSLDYAYGGYTFRFFLAILRVFFPNIQVPNTVMDFTIVDGMKTNVYTVLHWYTMDFGLLWAYIVQFIFGFSFGKLYKKVRRTNNPNIMQLVLLSMFMSIILGEFFCDQLASHTSVWIQRIVWVYLICRFLVQYIDNSRKKRKKIRIKF